MANGFVIRRWGLFAVISSIFFLITGLTYGSLGVIFPFMLEELNWSWTQLGTGFTILGLLTGITATIPARIIRKFNVKTAYGFGGMVMIIGFLLLATCTKVSHFYLAAALLGCGFSHCATVPAIHLLNNWIPDRCSFAIGAFMTIGGLGGVAGPILVISIESSTGSWRMYWFVAAAAMFFMTVLALLLVRDKPVRLQEQEQEKPVIEERSERVYTTTTNWNYRDVIRCQQFYVIVAAMTMTLLCTITMSNWAVIHMGTLGISTAIGATAMSTQALLNAISRACGGLLATRIDPKWILFAALLFEVMGMMALSAAENNIMIAVFVIGEGCGFGLCLFATTILLINYFGPRDIPEILGTLNLITTLATLGPVLAGYAGDKIGGFAIVFQCFAILLLLIAVAVAFMHPPQGTKHDQSA